MSSRTSSGTEEPASTYIAYDRRLDKEEIRRLTLQDDLMTEAMGGVLAEQPEPAALLRVLDVGCGTGGWVLAAAQAYPAMQLVGLDLSPRRLAVARRRAAGQSRVSFRQMDALRPLDLASDQFDLVNVRFGVSFIRRWEWPLVIGELLRVCRPGGVVRLTEGEIIQHSTSQALRIFQKLLWRALHQGGHLWEDEGTGLMNHLVPLLEGGGASQVQTRGSVTVYRAGTPEGQAYVTNVSMAMQTLKPFITKWVGTSQEYEEVCHAARVQMQHPHFAAIGQLQTAWGYK